MMNPEEYRIFDELIAKLEQARNLLCRNSPVDPYLAKYCARFVDGSKTTLTRAREIRENAKPL